MAKSSVERLKEAMYSRSKRPEVNPLARSPLGPSHEHHGRLSEEVLPPMPQELSGSSDASAPVAPPGFVPSTPSTASPVSTAPLKKAAPEAPRSVPPPLSSQPPIFTMTQTKRRASPGSVFFLLSSLVFFVVAAGVAAWTILGGANIISPQHIDLQIVAPALVDSGKTATLQFIINNRNDTALRTVDLVLDYPDGTRSASDPTQALPHDRISIGDIAAGAQSQQTASAVFFGAEGAQQKVTATIEYQLAGSNAIFTKQADVMFVIGSAPIAISIDSPNEAISGQPFDMTLRVAANATNPIADVAVEAQYPFGFSVQQVTPAANAGSTLWRLGQLKPGDTRTIKITGVLTGEDGDERVFHFLSGSQSDPTETHISVPVISTPQTLTIHRPFVSGTIAINGKAAATFAAPSSGVIQGSIAWQNNLPDTVSNMQVTLSLSGAVDPASVQAQNGFYDSTKQQIVWTSQDNADFSSVGPGATGGLQFSFSPAAAGTQAAYNPHIDLKLSVQATRGGAQGQVPQSVSSAAAATIQLASALQASSQAFYFSGPFRNTGPVPPKVGQNTSYGIVWSLKNPSNTIANARMSAALPVNVTFAGAGSGGESVSYDETTRTVSWSIGDIKPGVGYALPSRTASFQVVLTPSASQVGQGAALVGVAHLVGEDRYAQAQVTTDAPAITTRLDSDTGFSQGMERVGQ